MIWNATADPDILNDHAKPNAWRKEGMALFPSLITIYARYSMLFYFIFFQRILGRVILQKDLVLARSRPTNLGGIGR